MDTFLKDAKLLYSICIAIKQFQTALCPDNPGISIKLINDRIIFRNETLKPSKISLKEDKQRFVTCLMFVAQYAGSRGELKQSGYLNSTTKVAAEGFLDILQDSTYTMNYLNNDLDIQETTYRSVGSPGSGIWNYCSNLGDLFNLEHLVQFYEYSRNKQFDNVPVPLLLWEIVDCFFSEPKEYSNRADDFDIEDSDSCPSLIYSDDSWSSRSQSSHSDYNGLDHQPLDIIDIAKANPFGSNPISEVF